MRPAWLDRLRRHWPLLVYVASVVLVTFQFGGRDAANNIKIFRWSFQHLLRAQDIYGQYPGLYYDVFKYSPTWALLFAPFAAPPAAIGFLLWDLCAAVLFYYAIVRLLPGPPGRVALAIAFFEFVAAMQHASTTNAVVAALIILAFVAFEEDRQGLAALCIGVGVLMKLYPLAALSFAAFHPRKPRFALVFVGVLAGLIAVPVLVTTPSALAAQWRSWGHTLAADTAASGWSLMSYLQQWFGVDWPNWSVQLGGMIMLLLPLALRRDRWSDPHFRRLFLCSVLLYCLIFNHQAERPSAVVGFTGIALWYAMSPRTWFRTAVMALAFIAVPLLHSSLVPWVIRLYILPGLGLITLSCFLVWWVIQAELLADSQSTPLETTS
ncbi:MAG TPA: glycosyltransferase family 87 protein [Gemmatimonadales bacterium]|nr:glycosyltransferase family 87 protein [Gemmatimonadales bacterium]